MTEGVGSTIRFTPMGLSFLSLPLILSLFDICVVCLFLDILTFWDLDILVACLTLLDFLTS